MLETYINSEDASFFFFFFTVQIILRNKYERKGG